MKTNKCGFSRLSLFKPRFLAIFFIQVVVRESPPDPVHMSSRFPRNSEEVFASEVRYLNLSWSDVFLYRVAWWGRWIYWRRRGWWGRKIYWRSWGDVHLVIIEQVERDDHKIIRNTSWRRACEDVMKTSI